MPSKQEDKDHKVKTPKKTRASGPSKKKKDYKNNKHSESDSDSDWLPPTDHHSDSEESESIGNEDMNPRELQKFIQKIFPSDAGKERLRQLEKIDDMIDKTKKKTKKSKPTKSKKNKKRIVTKKIEEEESSDDEIDDVLVLDDDDDECDEDEIKEMLSGNNMKFNIIFTVEDTANLCDYDEDGDEEEDEEEDEDEEDIVSTKDFKKMVTKQANKSDEEVKNTIKKKGLDKFKVKDKVLIKARGWQEEYPGVITKICTRNRYDIKLNDDELEQRKWKLIHAKYIKPITKEDEDYMETINDLRELAELRKGKDKKALMLQLDKLSKANERRIKEKAKEKMTKDQMKNVGKLKRMLKEKNVMNDFKYFKDMDVSDQQKILKKLKEVNEFDNVEKPYRLSLLESDIPVPFKAQALKKINILNYMEPGSGEYYKIKQWVDTFMRIPFGKRNSLPYQISDGRDKCGDFMEQAKKTLDECVYGLNDAKMQIMQYIAQWIANPDAIAPPIAIKGPPGTGKTTLIKEGISKILNRPFAFLALGGATDSSFLEGHSYTYEGSSCGKIVDILLQSKTMNPVIYFDELDKISDTPKGEEIAGILTHLTDTTQNSQFHDKYFSSIDFDLSKVLFIFSYNDESKVNSVLRDRMYRIHTKGYDSKEKLTIVRDFLIPKIEKNINFEKGQIIIPDDTLSFIITEFTEKEKGVRNLKRCLEILYTKINLYTLMKKDSKMFDGKVVLHIEFPYTINIETVKKLIKTNDANTVPFGMYI